MNTDPLNALWNSPTNAPASKENGELAARFLSRLRKHRRFQSWWLGWTFLSLTAVTLLAVSQVVRNGASGMTGQWALWPLLALPWTAAFLFLRRFWQEGSASIGATSTLRAALREAHAANLAERRRLLCVGALLVMTTPFSALAIQQLHDAGKTTAAQAWSMALVFGVGLALGGTFVLWRYWRHVVPERRRIQSLLHDLETA